MAVRAPTRPSRPPDDLGPVPFQVLLRSEPRVDSGEQASSGEPGVGLLPDLIALHARGWTARWEVRIGDLRFYPSLSEEFGMAEEFWVFLLELVEAESGEWSLVEGRDVLTLEAQVYGPDVIVDFAPLGSSPRFAGQALPRKATVRLRALISGGTGFFRCMVAEALRLDPGMGERPDLLAFCEDLDQLEAAVAELPGTFRSRDGA